MPNETNMEPVPNPHDMTTADLRQEYKKALRVMQKTREDMHQLKRNLAALEARKNQLQDELDRRGM